MIRFIAELKRRKVFRVAAVYAGTVFVVLQAADLVVEPLALPAWTMTLLIALAVVGFPLALALSWAFELTPAGLKRADAAGPQQSSEHRDRRGRGRRRTWFAVAGAASLLLVFAAGVMWRVLGPAPADAASHAVAVLPFEVRGSENIAYLDEGMVDLLSAKLSGADDIQVVDPRALLGFLSRHSAPAGENAGASVAARFGARFFVLGSVLEFGGEMQVRASLYEIGAEPRLIAEATAAGSDAELFRLVDELAAQLLAGRVVGASARLARLAAVTTDSIAALKEYLSAERAYRRTEFLRAIEHFRSALRVDSTFALAGYRLAAAATWTARPDLAREGLMAALRHSARLGDRDGLLLAAAAADVLDQDFVRADSLYRQILLTYRDEADAWYRLGEIVLHQAPYLAYPRAEAREPFERALGIDPEMGPALYHATNLAAERADTVAMDTLVRHFRRVSVDPSDSLFWSVDEIFFKADTNRFGWAERQIAITVEPVNGYYAHQAANLSLERDPAAARRLWSAVAQHSPSAPMRAWAHTALADIEVSHGRFRAAGEDLDRARGADVALAIQQHVQLALHPFHEAAPETLSRLEEEVQSWNPENSPAVTGALERVQFARDGPIVRSHLAGLIDLRLGDVAAARRRVAEIRRHDAADSLTASNLALILESEIARRHGDVHEALRLLESAPLWRMQAKMQAGTLSFAREVFERAELLRETQRADDAVRAYEVVIDNLPLFYRAPALFRLCELHAAAGRKEVARRACGRFLTLWRNADEELQPWAERAIRHAAPTSS